MQPRKCGRDFESPWRSPVVAVGFGLLVWSAAMLGQTQPRASAPSAGTGIIRGRVVTSSGAPAPIVDARVSIAGPATKEPVFSDDLGRFEFSTLAPGRYTLTAEKTGFARTRYGSRGELDVPEPIEVGVAAAVEGVQISM